jgi:hypothetical protein
VKDGVVGLHHTFCQLLDARELHFVFEQQLASPAYFYFEDFPKGKVGKSIIQNILDVGVVFWRHTPSQNTRSATLSGTKG